MTSEQFTYWLQGFAELNAEPPTPEQWQAIRDHLALVFEKRTPNYVPNQMQGRAALPYNPGYAGLAVPSQLRGANIC